MVHHLNPGLRGVERGQGQGGQTGNRRTGNHAGLAGQQHAILVENTFPTASLNWRLWEVLGAASSSGQKPGFVPNRLTGERGSPRPEGTSDSSQTFQHWGANSEFLASRRDDWTTGICCKTRHPVRRAVFVGLKAYASEDPEKLPERLIHIKELAHWRRRHRPVGRFESGAANNGRSLPGQSPQVRRQRKGPLQLEYRVRVGCQLPVEGSFRRHGRESQQRRRRRRLPWAAPEGGGVQVRSRTNPHAQYPGGDNLLPLLRLTEFNRKQDCGIGV